MVCEDIFVIFQRGLCEFIPPGMDIFEKLLLLFSSPTFFGLRFSALIATLSNWINSTDGKIRRILLN